jgi:hypothetical protein
MINLSFPRIRKLTIILGLVGGAIAIATAGLNAAAGFITGAAISLASFHSWVRLAEMLDPDAPTRPGRASAVFLALRYVLIAAVLYVIVKYLRFTAAAMIIGLLVSFAAVVIDLLFGLVQFGNKQS